MSHPARFVALPMVGLVFLVDACGSSSSGAVAKPSAGATKPSPAATSTAAPTVGPTDPSAEPVPQPAAIDLEIVKRKGAAVVIAPVKIHGKTYQFIVDTGASATVIDESHAKELGLKRTKDAPIPVVGIGGSEKAYLATISSWSLGRAKIPTSTITVSNIGLTGDLVGLLGSDVLSTFGRVTIDYDKQKATLG
jgi:hypothetical protein